MTLFFRTIALLAAIAAPAHATVLFQSDPDQTSGTGAPDYEAAGATFVGGMTVSQSATIGAIGVLDNLESDANLKFFVADADTGAMLYMSGPQAFAADIGGPLGLSYKVSAPMSFTFNPGVDYAVGSIADAATYTYADALQTNTANGFTSTLGNLTVSDYANPVLDTSQNCCSIGFELMDAPADVPEPFSWLLLATGLLGTALLPRLATVQK